MTDEGTSTLTLAIEASNPSMWPPASDGRPVAGEVALGEVTASGCTLLGSALITQRSPRDDALAPTIDRLLGRLSIRPAQLGSIAVSGGPGGFTSVRIALITAKTIAEAVGARVVVVPTAEAIARTVSRDHGSTGVLAVLLSGKRDTAWCTVFRPAPWEAPSWPAPITEGVFSAEQFAEQGGADGITALIADQHAPDAFIRWAEETGARVILPASSGGSVLAASAGRDAVDPADALPIYPREPEAVTKWRERTAG